MDQSKPDLPDGWVTSEFAVGEQTSHVKLVESDGRAYVEIERTSTTRQGPDFSVECFQFIADGNGNGTYVRSHVALAQSVPESLSVSRQFIDRFEVDADRPICFGSDTGQGFRYFYTSEASSIPDELDTDVLIELINEDDPTTGVSGLEEDIDVTRFHPDSNDGADLIVDIDIKPRDRDEDVYDVADDSCAPTTLPFDL